MFKNGTRRSPYGERGLKFGDLAPEKAGKKSLSLRRAWIEIIALNDIKYDASVALLTESVD